MCSCAKFLLPEKEKKRLSVSEYASLGRQLDELGCVSVNVTGGEPLMREDVADIITALNSRNKITSLITNGIRLSREKIRFYSSLEIDNIIVSLESAQAEENDRIRGYPGHFAAVMQIIKWAREEKVKLGISLTLGDFNFKKIYELIKFAQENSVFLYIAHGGSVGNWANSQHIFLSERNAQEVLSLIKRHKRMKIDFSANLSLYPGCPAILEKIFITPYGDILPCTFIPISFGNLRQEPLAVIWKRMINFYSNNVRRKTLCLRSYSQDFIQKFLFPIKDMQQPVSISSHPSFGKEQDQ
jgi:MoaA/NifB/PqqE/SkfB family radical SAM enzyme